MNQCRLQWKFHKATRQPTLFAVIVWRHTVWPLLYNVLGGWIFRREHAGSLVEQLLTGDHATHLQQLSICLLTYRVLFGLDSFACILLCSILVAAIQEIRAAVFRFFQETTSYAGTQMVAAAFDAGKRHQDKMLLETRGSRSVSILWVLSQQNSWKRLLFVHLTVRTREGVWNTRSVGWNTSFWFLLTHDWKANEVTT